MEKTGISGFGANDTSYIEITPVWDSHILGISLDRPTDIIVGPDGYLWVANSGQNEIIGIKKSGEVLHQYNFDRIQPIPQPLAISLDSHLNLYIVNGSNVIYVWNEYLNYAGVRAVAFQAVFQKANGDTVHRPVEFVQSGGDSLTFESYLFSEDENQIQRVLEVHEFYKAPEEKLEFYGVAAGKYGSDEVYVSESFRHRIARFRLVPYARIRLSNGWELFAYKGRFEKNVMTYGSGAGTVDSPRGLYVDKNGNLYLTQWGGNFLVQKLKAGSFISEYELYTHPIMDLKRFQQPTDITLDAQNNIFIVDRQLKQVFKFDNEAPNAGKEINLGNKGLAVAEFIEPMGIVVADDVVYVTDAGANQIRRFKLSLSEKDVPEEPGNIQP